MIGRGFSDVCVYAESIYSKVVRLLESASVPVLTNISLAMESVEQCELYPFPIQDLFMGSPLLVAGKYRTHLKFPDRITIRGTLPDGRMIAMDVLTMVNPLIPVNKVFLKQRLDLLTARAWLEESKEIEAEVVRISVEESMPSAYTSMVAYEVSDKRRKEIEEEQANRDKKQTDKKQEQKTKDPKPKNRGVSGKTIAAIAVGGVIVLGVAAFAFGDLAATVGNLGIPGDLGLSHLFSAVSHCGGCHLLNCFGDCSSCGPCGGCLNQVGNCLGGCLHGVSGVFSCICGDGCSNCGHCFSAIYNFCGSICNGNCIDSIGHCCSAVISGCGSVCGDCGSLLGHCGELCKGLWGVLSELSSCLPSCR